MDNNLVSVNYDGRIITTSLLIAEHFGKTHDNVLKAVRRAECSPEFSLVNFNESKYKSERGREYPCYNITRDGFMFLVMGFTGKEAAMWKERFINAFNMMEKKLRDQERTESILKHLRGKDFSIYIGYDQKISFSMREPGTHFIDTAKAIKDPTNIGLKDETIRMVADACLEALTYRAKTRSEWGAALNKRLNEIDPERKKLKRM